MDWKTFRGSCPEIADLAENRFRHDQLVMMATLRRSGMPRISPCEVDFANGQILFGMMWQSPKALDLLRDPRLTVHSVTLNKDGTDGDVKLYGRALDVQNPSERNSFREAIQERIDWAPEDPNYHLFTLDVDSAAFIVFDNGNKEVLVWDEEKGFRKWSKME